MYDVHATILHLLGVDDKKLTFRHTGIDRRLTDVYGEVIPDLTSCQLSSLGREKLPENDQT